MELKPLFNNVVVKEIKDEKRANSVIILPDEDSGISLLGEVLAVGDGGYVDGVKIDMMLAVGDKVIFNSYSASNFILQGTTYILINQTDVLAKVK